MAGQPHRWKKGERVPGAKPWKPGQSGNPSGKPKGLVAAQTRGLKIISDLAEQAINKPENQAAIAEQIDNLVKKDIVRALKEIYIPLGVQINMTATQTGSGEIVRRMTVTQLKELAAEVEDDGDRDFSPPLNLNPAKTIDVEGVEREM